MIYAVGKCKQKKADFEVKSAFLAEREGFEPPVPLGTSVFKTGAIDHSATSPNKFIKKCGRFLLTLQRYSDFFFCASKTGFIF